MVTHGRYDIFVFQVIIFEGHIKLAGKMNLSEDELVCRNCEFILQGKTLRFSVLLGTMPIQMTNHIGAHSSGSLPRSC